MWTGVDNVWEQGKLEARKMLLNRADSHTSGARGVRRRDVAQDSLAVKDLPAKMLTKLLHETETLATTIKHNLTQMLAFQTTATNQSPINQNANLQKTNKT